MNFVMILFMNSAPERRHEFCHEFGHELGHEYLHTVSFWFSCMLYHRKKFMHKFVASFGVHFQHVFGVHFDVDWVYILRMFLNLSVG